MLGYTKEELLETPFLEIKPTSTYPALKKGARPLFDNKYMIFETQHLTKDGKIIDTEVSTHLFQMDGKDVVLEIVRDISERKESERKMKQIMTLNQKLLKKAVESEKLKTEFFTTISHELKTPLNIISSTIQLLEKFCLETEDKDYNYRKVAKRYLQIERQNCYRLTRLINNLLDVTKIDSGFFKLNKINANIVQIVEDITLSTVEYAKAKKLHLIFDTETEEKVMGCDPEHLERIMLNLLSNAIKHTESGGTIEVNIYDRKNTILISVKDTGEGIPEDMQDKIFNRFQQVDLSLQRRSEGTGIGLALVKELVGLHNGKINVVSTWGEGSKFIIELPVQLVESNDSSYKLETSTYTDMEKVHVELSDIYS